MAGHWQRFHRPNFRSLFDGAAHEVGQLPLEAEYVDLDGYGIASEEAFGLPVLNGAVGVRCTGIASAEAFGTASIQTGRAISGAGAIASAEAFSTRTKLFLSHNPIAISSRTTLGLGVCGAGNPQLPKVPGTVRIMAVGDSITQGVGDPAQNSWRFKANSYLTACGLTVSWIGDQQSGTAPSNRHHAIIGTTVVDHSIGGIVDLMAQIGAGHTYRQVNVFVVFLGTNDANNATLTANFQTNFETFIGQVHAAETEARFVVVYPPASSNRQANIDIINNTHLPAAIANLRAAGRKIVEVDGRILTGDPGVSAAHYLRSEANGWLHPNPDGYLLLADPIARGILNAAGYNAAWYGDVAA